MAHPPRPREAITTADFDRWYQGLNPELRAHVREAIDHIVTRVLFAFDSNRNPIMLLGGDKTGSGIAGTRRRCDSPNAFTWIMSEALERSLDG